MTKENFSRTKACATKTLYAVMKEMSRRGGSMPAKELYPFVTENVTDRYHCHFLCFYTF